MGDYFFLAHCVYECMLMNAEGVHTLNIKSIMNMHYYAYECMLMNAEGIVGAEAGGRAMARHSGVEKDFDTGEGEEETGRNGLL